MLNKFFYALFIVFMMFIGAGCSGPVAEIEGRVIDDKGDPLSGVAVNISKTRYETLTDDAGQYIIPYAPGRFEIIYSKFGYVSKTLLLDIQEKVEFPAETIVLEQDDYNSSVERLGAFLLRTLAEGNKAAFETFLIMGDAELLKFAPHKFKGYQDFEVLEQFKSQRLEILESWDERSAIFSGTSSSWSEAELSEVIMLASHESPYGKSGDFAIEYQLNGVIDYIEFSIGYVDDKWKIYTPLTGKNITKMLSH